MTAGEALFVSQDPAEQPIFSAVIRPHRSLGRQGFRVLMGVAAAVTAIGALRMALLGFWPVSGFFVLDFVALAVAFRVSYRRAAAIEEIVVTPIEILLRRVSHKGVAREWRLNPFWTRLHQVDDEEYGLQRLVLVSRGREFLIARELSPPERAHFADEFGRALAQVKKTV